MEKNSLKRGKLFGCQLKLLPLLDAKFNVDYDSAIKHDLAQCCDEVMDVQSWCLKKAKYVLTIHLRTICAYVYFMYGWCICQMGTTMHEQCINE